MQSLQTQKLSTGKGWKSQEPFPFHIIVQHPSSLCQGIQHLGSSAITYRLISTQVLLTYVLNTNLKTKFQKVGDASAAKVPCEMSKDSFLIIIRRDMLSIKKLDHPPSYQSE
ncbi:hypothetical protein Bpfe_011009 [Biomphalaria pfeifferi]|uniref:Uncharacterized protein n=1 Tax=Biomphalaria pfeifferi TaxID=112525 RepID=A0AAD8BRV1_BIOPF|nr:hypothetical protein Bpfe_011009 [Biomphalaria pfeifferi]